MKPEVVERAVKNVIRFKIQAGMMDENRYLYSDDEVVLDSEEERKTAYDIATQSVVLLENNGVLPLKNVKRVLLTGPNAN